PAAANHFHVTVPKRHDDDHRLGLALVNEVVENHIGPADCSPPARVIAETMQQIQHWIFLLPAGVVVRGSIDIEITNLVSRLGMEEMMMEFPVWNVVQFPRCCSRPWDMHRAFRGQEVRLHQLVGWVNQGLTILNDGIAVDIGIIRPGGHGPSALIVFLHCYPMGLSFQLYLNLARVRSIEPEGHAPIFLDLGRDDVWRGLCQSSPSRQDNHPDEYCQGPSHECLRKQLRFYVCAEDRAQRKRRRLRKSRRSSQKMPH